ncbi:MAG: ABC transporter permease [Christensenellales bacterium]
MRKEKWLYILLVPGIIYYVLFVYKPMWSILIAFQNFSITRGIWGSEWVGLKHFERFVTSMWFGTLFRNTVVLAVLNLIFYFPAPIILALLLNELRHQRFKRMIQSLTYLPHFLSWVVIVSMFQQLLTVENGTVNILLNKIGFETVPFLQSTNWFRPVILIQIIWKEVGWGTIIFLAALSGVDVSLYEAAIVDGANHRQQLWHITLPGIRGTIITLLILRMGNFMNTGFEQIYLMTNSMNRDVAEVFDTYVYRLGIGGGQFSYSTAVGLFKSIIGLVLVTVSDRIAKHVGEEGIL